MAPAPAALSGLARLVEPPASVQSPLERRRARAALAVLLALVAFGVVDVVASLSGAYGGSNGHSDVLVEAGVVLALVGGYLLVRTGRIDVGVAFSVLAIELVIWHFRSHAVPGPGEVTTLYFLAVPLLVSGLLLRLKPAVLVATVTIVGMLVGESALDQGSGLGLDVDDFGLFLLLLVVAVLAVTASALYERDARELHETSRLLQQVTQNIPQVFFLVSGDGKRMLYTSPAYTTMTGRSVEQALADPQDWLKSVHPEDLPQVQRALGNNQPDLEYRVLHPSGETKHVRARTFPILDGAGKLDRLVGVAEDVSAAKRAEEAIRQAQQERIHLLQQLAHDLASPLSPIKIQLRMLRDGVPAESQHGLAVVQRNVDHIQRLVEDIKDLARLEGGGLQVQRKDNDLAILARQAVETLAATAAERQVTLVLDAPVALPAKVDAGRITQVLYNLMGNAMKFTPPGGNVELRLRALGTEAEVGVRDSGTGMRPDQLERLFKPFSQVHDPQT